MTSYHEIVIRNFKVHGPNIVWIKAVLESYEGMVVVRTAELSTHTIELLIARDFAPLVDCVLHELKTQVWMQEVPATVDAAAWRP